MGRDKAPRRVRLTWSRLYTHTHPSTHSHTPYLASLIIPLPSLPNPLLSSFPCILFIILYFFPISPPHFFHVSPPHSTFSSHNLTFVCLFSFYSSQCDPTTLILLYILLSFLLRFPFLPSCPDLYLHFCRFRYCRM